jgi:hypothetical protein
VRGKVKTGAKQMKRSLASMLAIGGGGLLGFLAKRVRWTRKPSAGDLAMRRLTKYFIIPVWIGAGFLDYIWHRRTRIETTSGVEESLMHTLMMVEAAPPVLGALFLEINAGVLAWMIGLAFLHEATVLWDLWYTTPRRAIPAGEQITHTFLEAPPFVVAAAAIVTHWDQFLALVGHRGRRNFTVRLQPPPVPAATIAMVAAALVLVGALPHADELRRCIAAKRAGLAGRDTPACLPEVFA